MLSTSLLKCKFRDYSRHFEGQDTSVTQVFLQQPSCGLMVTLPLLTKGLQVSKQQQQQAKLEVGCIGAFYLHAWQQIAASVQVVKQEEEAEDKEKPLPLLPTLKALSAAWAAASQQTANQRAQDMTHALREALQPGQTSSIHNRLICTICACFGVQQHGTVGWVCTDIECSKFSN